MYVEDKWLYVNIYPRKNSISLQYEYTRLVGLGGLGVTCSPRDPRFAGSNTAEVDGFLQDVILCIIPPGGT